MKNIIKTIIFLLIFIFTFDFVFNILWLSKNPISYFYKEPKNSIDVVYIGSSNAYAHFNTTLAYNLHGFTTGLLSCDSQPFGMVKYLMIESKKFQSPKLYVIDIAKLVDDLSSIEEGAIRTSVDSMKFSKNRIDAVNELLSYNNKFDNEKLNYYFSFLKYHNKWKEISVWDFIYNSVLYKGYLFTNDTAKISSQKKVVWDNTEVKLNDENYRILIDLIKYINENNLNVLFVIPNRNFELEQIRELNNAENIILRNNYKIVNFNKLYDLDINYSSDLYNEHHINVYGATKYTAYFSKYLVENYNLPNHKNDEDYKSWKKEYERFKKSFKEITHKDFDELLKEYNIS